MILDQLIEQISDKFNGLRMDKNIYGEVICWLHDWMRKGLIGLGNLSSH